MWGNENLTSFSHNEGPGVRNLQVRVVGRGGKPVSITETGILIDNAL
jgi:hypothetical protein